MKGKLLLLLLLTSISTIGISQEVKPAREKHGTALNVGVGIGGYSGYYRHIGVYVPVVHLDVEFDVARNFTLAPFINFYSSTFSYQLENPYRNYTYRINVMPIGVKGTYYLDELFKAGPNWDFYVGGSLGLVLVKTTWNDNYYVNNGYYREYYYDHGNQFFLDGHIGAEYHVSKKVGFFLDLSNGLSTIGIAIH